MRTQLCERLGIEAPIFAFSHCRDVVAAVSRSGGFGVLGALAFSPSQLETELAGIDDHVGGKPYGVVIVMPASSEGGDLGFDPQALEAMISEKHRGFVQKVLDDYGVPKLPEGEKAHAGLLGWVHDAAREQVEIALRHPIKMIVNALGAPPRDVIDRVHAKGILIAALVGTVEQAKRQVESGVDVVVAQGTEAGGHTGEVATMVLVPDVVDAIAPTPVLAAGAQGAWIGTLFAATREAMRDDAAKQRLVDARETDTVLTRVYDVAQDIPWPERFPGRALRTEFTDRWHGHEGDLAGDREAASGSMGEYDYAGQAVGAIHRIESAADVVEHLAREAEWALAEAYRQTSG